MVFRSGLPIKKDSVLLRIYKITPRINQLSKFSPKFPRLATIFTVAVVVFASGLHADPAQLARSQNSAQKNTYPIGKAQIGIEPASTTPTNSLVVATTTSATEELPSEFKPLSLLNESLWQRLSAGFEFSKIDNKRVDKQIRFLQAGLRSLRSNLIDASPYLFYIADQLDHSGVPLDIAMLPLIESAFNPTALSSESAVGIWQFIPATAIHYGLSVEKNNDQRKDVMASTTAAIRYLTDLHRIFEGDWMLALAAYNTGPGNVRSAMRRAVKRGLEPTYWNLKLSEETSNYVPRLIAATKMVSEPEAYGLVLPPLANQKQIASVSVGRRISLQHVADLTDISIEEVTSLNPGLHRGLTPIDGPHRLILPVATTHQLLAELSNLKRQPLVDGNSGAAMVNREISDPFVIDNKVDSASNLPDNQNYTPYKTYNYKTHTVVPGDSLWKVSRKLNVDIETLRRWNDLEPGKPIKAGDQLSVAYITTEIVNTEHLIRYRVRATDSLVSIADKFDLHIGEIKKWNNGLRHENHVQAGQVLRIPTYPSSTIGNYGPWSDKPILRHHKHSSR